MKRITLLSDTHGHLDDRIRELCTWGDEIWHAGDIGNIAVADELKTIKPFKAVFGNIDGTQARADYPLHNRFMCEDVDVWITHIGGYPGRYDKKVIPEILNNPPKLFITGHSHILKVMMDKKLGCLHMNPGAAGKSGFHSMRTMLRFEIDKAAIQKLEVIELGKR